MWLGVGLVAYLVGAVTAESSIQIICSKNVKPLCGTYLYNGDVYQMKASNGKTLTINEEEDGYFCLNLNEKLKLCSKNGDPHVTRFSGAKKKPFSAYKMEFYIDPPYCDPNDLYCDLPTLCGGRGATYCDPTDLYCEDTGNNKLDTPPPELQLHVNIYMDREWKNEFGKIGGYREAEKILEHTKSLFVHQTLETKIHILTNSNRYYESTAHLLPSRYDYDKLPGLLIGPETVEGQPTVHIYLTVGNSPRLGLTASRGMCYTHKGKPRTMVQYKDSAERTAMVLAHELGHFLGMEHDFSTKNLNNRNITCGDAKNSGKTIMNYGEETNSWSECSNSDFQLYYKKVVAYFGEFCLKKPSGKCECLDPEYSSCPIYKKCYIACNNYCPDQIKSPSPDKCISEKACGRSNWQFHR